MWIKIKEEKINLSTVTNIGSNGESIYFYFVGGSHREIWLRQKSEVIRIMSILDEKLNFISVY